MNEIISVGGVEYPATNVTTGLDTISFGISDLTANETEMAFKNAESLTVSDGTGKTYGEYPDIRFEALTLRADGSVTVSMHILTETEKQIKELQRATAEHDEVLAAMMFGGKE